MTYVIMIVINEARADLPWLHKIGKGLIFREAFGGRSGHSVVQGGFYPNILGAYVFLCGFGRH